MIFKTIRQAFKLIKKQKEEARATAQLLDDPVTIELLERLAVRHHYYFEIVRADGTRFRFSKRQELLEDDDIKSRSVW